MRRWVLGMAGACLCAATLGTSPVQADGGVIRFVGAVYAPTCGGAADHSPGQQGLPLVHCAGPAASSAHQGAVYRLNESPLRDHAAEGNPMLDYFIGYLSEEQRGQARLVTRTYL